MSDLKVDGVIASTGTNTNLTLQGKGSGKVAIGDGALLFPDADGSDGQFIKTDGSAALSFAAAGGGAWTFISDTSLSGANVTTTGFAVGSYRNYVIIYNNLLPSTDSGQPRMKFGDSGGLSTTAYYGHFNESTSGSASYSGTAFSNTGSISIENAFGNQSTETGSFICYLYMPNGTTHPMLSWHGCKYNATPTPVFCNGFGILSEALVLDRIDISFHSGNIASGSQLIYGISHA